MSSSSQSGEPEKNSSSSSYQNEGPTPFQLGIAALILGTSAGFTMYTKKTASMLNTMKKMEESRLRRNPPKFGPPTKEQWEKIRPRIDKDEFF